ncbi:hypothetical protein [Comamonas sp.]|uniref:hypothetical protein n=1 Tax=Comamonas sp. TaxID=34028 RepID=UPI0028993B3F|nr:hypothetical protein [Comamonas sp.]
MNLARLLAAISFLLMTGIALSAESAAAGHGKESNCIDQWKERTAALAAEDWPQLSRIAERYIKTCKGVFGTESYSVAYEEAAIALNNLGKASQALSASDKCIGAFYANSACHVQRAQALATLEKYTQAHAALDKADRLITHAIEVGQRDLNGAKNSLERELFEARLGHLAAQRSHASAIRDRYFPK